MVASQLTITSAKIRSVLLRLVGKTGYFLIQQVERRKSATIYTVVQSARENGLRIEPYLNHIFDTLSTIDPRDWSDEIIESLLPHSKDLPFEIYTAIKLSK